MAGPDPIAAAGAVAVVVWWRRRPPEDMERALPAAVAEASAILARLQPPDRLVRLNPVAHYLVKRSVKSQWVRVAATLRAAGEFYGSTEVNMPGRTDQDIAFAARLLDAHMRHAVTTAFLLRKVTRIASRTPTPTSRATETSMRRQVEGYLDEANAAVNDLADALRRRGPRRS